jgi:cytochrome oxidase assembly protein ShyY1
LGVWQTQRYQWKVKLIEDQQRKLHETPSLLPVAHSQQELRDIVEDLKGSQFIIEGEFDHSKEILLGCIT